MKPSVARAILLGSSVLLGSQWAMAPLGKAYASENEHEDSHDSHDDHGSSGGGGSGSGGGGSGSSGGGGSGSSGGGSSGGGSSGSGGSGSSGGGSGSGSSGGGGSGSSGGGGSGSSGSGGESGSGAQASAPSRPAIQTPEERARDIVKSGQAKPYAAILPTVKQAVVGDILNILLMPSPQGYVYETWVLTKDGRNLAIRVDAVRNKLIDIRSR